jgi:hypothetical protein
MAKRKRANTRVRRVNTASSERTDHPIGGHAEMLRKLVNDKLAAVGINDVSLKAMHFDASDANPCPPGQHQEMVCRTMPDGSKVCNLECVPD